LAVASMAQNLIETYNSGISNGWTHTFNVTQGNQYRIAVSGQFSMGTVCPIFEMDPAFWIPPYNGGTALTHSCNDAWFIQGYCNGSVGIRPTPDVYNPLHSYDYFVTASSNNIVVGFNDCYNGDNCGSITFALYDVLNTVNTNVGIKVLNPQRSLHVNDVIRLDPRDAPPSNPVKGDMYFDGILNKLRVYDGTTWQSCWQ